jgi:DNA-directed RNA polymerase subunit D
MVSVEVVSRSPDGITVILKDVPLEYANALRRASLEEVPTMAVDYVVFYDNTSALADEIISHGIAMIPLTSEKALDRYKPPEVCKEGKQVDGCYTSLYLEAEAGPGEVVTVYSDRLKPQEDPDVAPVRSDIPIIVLGPGQRVVLEAWARLGRGREHAKWSPATVASLTYLALIGIDRGRCTKCGLCSQKCPTGAIRMVDGELVVREDLCNLCRQCVKVCEPEAVSLGWRRDAYRLHIESSGALSPERILVQSVVEVRRKLLEFYENLEKALSGVGGG